MAIYCVDCNRLEDELDEVRKERDRLRQEVADWKLEERESARLYQKAVDDTNALKRGLRRFGDHEVANPERIEQVKIYDCAVADGDGCDCGYEAYLEIGSEP